MNNVTVIKKLSQQINNHTEESIRIKLNKKNGGLKN
jgi:hypothetical protein